MREQLRERFEYKEGRLYYKVTVRGHKKGEVAGFLSDETGMVRRHITFKKKRLVHARVVWMYHHGDIPSDKTIDHINRDALDDRIENLRLATKRQQSENRNCLGVTFDKRRNYWVARIRRDGKTKYLGSRKTKEEALELRRRHESDLTLATTEVQITAA